jgi:hypothetical protein
MTNTTPPQTTAPAPPKPVEAPGYKPGLATSTGYTTAPYKVEPQGLVQNQLKGIVAEDSPLMQQAARIASQKANERGLINSSMAVGAGHEAVIGQAMPIAQADAATYDRAMTNTANQENAARQFDATAKNNVALANQAATNEALKSQQQGTIALTDRKMTNDVQVALANLDAETKMALTTMDNRTRSLLQTNQSASNAYVQAITNINQIQNNNQMSAAAKKTAINNQLALLRQQMASLSAIDRTGSDALAYPQELIDLNLGNYFQTIPEASPSAAKGTPAKPAPAATGASGMPGVSSNPVYTQAGGSQPASGTRQNPGGIAGPNSRKPGGIPQERLVEQGGPPPWPGAIKRGTTTTGGRQIYDVYY